MGFAMVSCPRYAARFDSVQELRVVGILENLAFCSACFYYLWALMSDALSYFFFFSVCCLYTGFTFFLCSLRLCFLCLRTHPHRVRSLYSFYVLYKLRGFLILGTKPFESSALQ